MGVIVQNLNCKAQRKDICDKEAKVFHRKIERVLSQLILGTEDVNI